MTDGMPPVSLGSAPLSAHPPMMTSRLRNQHQWQGQLPIHGHRPLGMVEVWADTLINLHPRLPSRQNPSAPRVSSRLPMQNPSHEPPITIIKHHQIRRRCIALFPFLGSRGMDLGCFRPVVVLLTPDADAIAAWLSRTSTQPIFIKHYPPSRTNLPIS